MLEAVIDEGEARYKGSSIPEGGATGEGKAGVGEHVIVGEDALEDGVDGSAVVDGVIAMFYRRDSVCEDADGSSTGNGDVMVRAEVCNRVVDEGIVIGSDEESPVGNVKNCRAGVVDTLKEGWPIVVIRDAPVRLTFRAVAAQAKGAIPAVAVTDPDVEADNDVRCRCLRWFSFRRDQRRLKRLFQKGWRCQRWKGGMVLHRREEGPRAASVVEHPVSIGRTRGREAAAMKIEPAAAEVSAGGGRRVASSEEPSRIEENGLHMDGDACVVGDGAVPPVGHVFFEHRRVRRGCIFVGIDGALVKVETVVGFDLVNVMGDSDRDEGMF